MGIPVMRTTLELLRLLEGNRFAIYDFTNEECESVLGLTYKISNRSGTSYFMPIKVSKETSFYLYNKVYNVLGFTFVNEPKKPWTNLTIYSIDDSMFRGILHGKYDIDNEWPKVYEFFKNYSSMDQETFIEFCKTQLNITEFDWN